MKRWNGCNGYSVEIIPDDGGLTLSLFSPPTALLPPGISVTANSSSEATYSALITNLRNEQTVVAKTTPQQLDSDTFPARLWTFSASLRHGRCRTSQGLDDRSEDDRMMTTITHKYVTVDTKLVKDWTITTRSENDRMMTTITHK